MRYQFAFCLILALALLTGCTQDSPAAPVSPGPVEETTQSDTAAETPHESPAETPEVDQIPIEILPDAALEPVPADLSWTDNPVEGLVEDTVGYAYQLPVFSGLHCADAITGFYSDLLPELENYARETVYLEAMDRHTVVSVYGTYTVEGVRDNQLVVSYEVRAEYSEGDPVVSARTDYFDLETGEHRSME